MRRCRGCKFCWPWQRDDVSYVYLAQKERMRLSSCSKRRIVFFNKMAIINNNIKNQRSVL